MQGLFRFSSRLILAPALSLCFTAVGLAQQPAARPPERGEAPTATLRTTVRRVILDVVVTDRAGKPVPGLALADFAIAEDGKPQKPLSFDLHGFDDTMDYTPSALPDEPPNTFINLPANPERGPLYVLLYDLVNTEQADQIFARRQLVKFIEEKPAGARFAIFVFSDGLHLIQGFTSDQKQLFAAIDPKRSRNHIPMVFLMGNNNGQGDPKTMQEVFNFIGGYLNGLPGRKNIIWLSGAFPLSLFASDEEVASYQEKTRRMLDMLARDQVSIYPVSARGVIDHMENAPAGATSASGGGIDGDNRDLYSSSGTSGTSGTGGIAGPGGGTTPGGGSNRIQGSAPSAAAGSGAGYSITLATQTTMDEVARMTGGRAFYSRNDLHLALNEATDDGSSYYTLSYAPTNHDYNGKLRTISVKLEKRGYHLAYRQGYYGTDPNAGPAAEEDKVLASLDQPEARQPGDSLSANMEHGAPVAHQLVFGTHVRALGSPSMGTLEQMANLAQQPAFSYGRSRRARAKPLAPVKLQILAVDYAVIARQFAVPGSTVPPVIEVAAAAYDADGRILNAVVNKAVEDDLPVPGTTAAAPSAAPDQDASQASGAGSTDSPEQKSGQKLLQKPEQKKVYRIEQRIEVPASAVSLRIAMRDTHTDRIGAMEIPLPLAPDARAALPATH